MVSNRCKMAVKEVMKQLGLPVVSVDLGVVEIDGVLSEEIHSKLQTSLQELGFELIVDRNTLLIEQIKNAILEMIYHTDEISQINFSEYLSNHLNHDYSYLANVFSKVEGTTIEHFVIAHKVERVKELIIYDEINITEIAYRLNYSSVAHLSAQFKKITGLSPSDFKRFKMIK
jgi:AraC-like DNA-binding protein